VDENNPADRAVYFSKLTACGEKEMVDGDRALSTLTDFFGAGPEQAGQRFHCIQLFPWPRAKH
jgi:hypothetical protein